jgi:hypothetical protein
MLVIAREIIIFIRTTYLMSREYFGDNVIISIQKIGSQMAVRLSALRTNRALLPRKIIFSCFRYLFLLGAEETPEPTAAERIR